MFGDSIRMPNPHWKCAGVKLRNTPTTKARGKAVREKAVPEKYIRPIQNMHQDVKP